MLDDRRSEYTVRRIRFFGGIHSRDNKELTNHLPLEKLDLPSHLFIPLQQHTGNAATPIINKGDEIVCGDLIARADGKMSANIHSPASGKVIAIKPVYNQQELSHEVVTILVNRESIESHFLSPLNIKNLKAQDIIERITEAGIVGLGGAAFPTAVKLSPPKDAGVDTLILNGCECEPYLTRDYRLMIEKPFEILSGMQLMMNAAGIDRGVIGIEDNKPLAIQLMNEAVKENPNIQIFTVKTRYPQGAEKLLIYAATGRKVPPGKLPFDVGVIVQNIATAFTAYEAITLGIPQMTAFVTVAGKGIRQPKNLQIPVGTPIRHVIDACGGITEDAKRIIAGGPMMGSALFDLDTPITKATSGILALTQKELKIPEETSCLKCGKCLEACPMYLVPNRLVRNVQTDRIEEAVQMGISTCMECGCCSYVCPANIPLVQWLRLGKQKCSLISSKS